MVSNENMNYAFDWDSEIKNDSSFVLLPEGVYDYEVVGFERGHYDGGAKLPPCPKAIITIKVNGGDLGSAQIVHNLYLHSRCEGLLCEFFTSCGLRKRGEALKMDWQRIIGTAGRCKVYVEEWTGRDGATHKSNKIERFLEPVVEQPATPGKPWQGGTF